MSCNKCESGCGSKKLCPVSLGLAIGLVAFFAVLFWSLWVMAYGIPPAMAAFHIAVPTAGAAFLHALLGLVKGFIAGFFIALFYDCFACCMCKCKCCKKTCHHDGKPCDHECADKK